MAETYSNIACTVCACVCDDLELTVEADRITRARGACNLAERWFLDQETVSPQAAEVDSRPVSVDAAVAAAARILADARSPLIFGLSRGSTEGQRAAVALADALGATIDTTASYCHAPSIVAFQEVGESTASLGEARNRADLIIYWGSNPVRSHPRHLERYSADSVGLFTPGGRADRKLVVVDVKRTETAERADLTVLVEPESDFDVIWALRAMVRGQTPEPGRWSSASFELQQLARWVTECKSGIVFFGFGLARTGIGHRNVEALLQLVTDLNERTCFYARRMRVPGDVTGADSVLCWQTGYPFSVHLGRGYPRYNPGEFSADDMLARREVDACLFVGSEGTAFFSPEARAWLEKIPTIALDYPTAASTLAASVRFTTAIHGIHLPGTAYRMDEVPIPLRRVLPAKYPSDADILSAILDRVRANHP